ncbi:MAG: hypothetical protein WCB04_13970 [Mycobacteriales bacterium]
MTETATFPFAPAKAPEDEATPALSGRRKLFVLVAVGAVLAGLAGYFLITSLFGGGAATPAALPVAKGNPPAAVASAVPTPKTQTFLSSPTRNPFLPLVAGPAAAAAAAPAPAPVAPVAPAPAATNPATTPGMTTFKLVSVAGNKATANIDGVSYPVTVGQVFAGTYKLTATSGNACATFSHSGKTISLCEGQTLLF